MASAPSHISNASMLTKQKLLQSIQVKEHQKLLEQQLALTPTSQEILAQALKNAMAVSQVMSPMVQVLSRVDIWEPNCPLVAFDVGQTCLYTVVVLLGLQVGLCVSVHLH